MVARPNVLIAIVLVVQDVKQIDLELHHVIVCKGIGIMEL